MAERPVHPGQMPFVSQEAVRAINDNHRQASNAQNLMGGDGTSISLGGFDNRVITAPPAYRELNFLGIIAPPPTVNGTALADFTDARYWVYSAVLSQLAADFAAAQAAKLDVQATLANPIADPSLYGNWMVATNLAEIVSATHLLQQGRVVEITARWGMMENTQAADGIDPYRQFTFSLAPISTSALTVIYDVQWDSAAGKLQKKTVNLATGVISAWTDIDTAVACS